MKEQTAMMELIDYMKANFHLTDESLEKFEQLLEKEKEQMQDAYDEGTIYQPHYGLTFEEYYEETYLEESK